MHLWQPIPVSQEWNIRRCQCMVSVATILQIFTMELASGEQMKSIATARNSLSLHNGHLYCLVGRSSFPFSIYCQLCDQAVFWNLEVFDCSQSSFNNNQTADRTAGKDDRPSFLHNQTNEETHFLFLIVDHTKRKKNPSRLKRFADVQINFCGLQCFLRIISVCQYLIFGLVKTSTE